MKDFKKMVKWAGIFVSVLFIPTLATFGKYKESKPETKKENQ